MSYTVIYGVPEKGEIKELKEYKNSHLSAPIIWNKLSNEYLVDKESIYLSKKKQEDLWRLVSDDRLESFERCLLALTFDGIILRKKYFNEVCLAIDKWMKKFPTKKERYPCHFIEIKNDLETLDFKNYIGVCFCWTSVCGDIWYSDRENEYEETEMYDISKDKKHKFLFEYLDEIRINKKL